MASRKKAKIETVRFAKSASRTFFFKSVSNVGPDVVNPGARPHADRQPPTWNSLAQLCVRRLPRLLIGRRIAVRPSADTTVGPGWRQRGEGAHHCRGWKGDGGDGGGPQMRWEFAIYARQEESGCRGLAAILSVAGRRRNQMKNLWRCNCGIAGGANGF